MQEFTLEDWLVVSFPGRGLWVPCWVLGEPATLTMMLSWPPLDITGCMFPSSENTCHFSFQMIWLQELYYWVPQI